MTLEKKALENNVRKGENACNQHCFFSYSAFYFINSLPNDKILNQSKFKAFTDDKMKVNKKLKFGLGRVESIAGKGENAGNQHFLLFSQCFQKLAFPEVLKVVIAR